MIPEPSDPGWWRFWEVPGARLDLGLPESLVCATNQIHIFLEEPLDIVRPMLHNEDMPAITDIQFESAPNAYGDTDVIVVSFEDGSWVGLSQGDLVLVNGCGGEFEVVTPGSVVTTVRLTGTERFLTAPTVSLRPVN